MTQLRQFHLQFAFEAPRSLRENIQNQACSIEHPALQFALEISFLAR